MPTDPATTFPIHDEYAYLTTTGRVTGRAHEIEIWFFEHEGSLYLLSGGADRSDWVRNLRAEPQVSIRLGDRTTAGVARIVDDPTEAVQSIAREGLRISVPWPVMAFAGVDMADALGAARGVAMHHGGPLELLGQKFAPFAVDFKQRDGKLLDVEDLGVFAGQHAGEF